MRHIESWSCHNCHKRIHAWPCQYCGIGEDEHPDELALRNLVEEIAAKDAEIRQQAEDLERLRETIDKLTKSRREVATRAESLESKCAKMRELLVARDEEARSAFEFFRLNLPACDGECAPDGSCITERCLRCYAKYCAKHRGRNRIDAILEREEA